MKKILLFVSVITLFNTNLLSQNLNDSLLLFYPFQGNVNDNSGNAFHGSSANVVSSLDKGGNSNSAYYFNGTDSYINIPNNPKLKPSLPITISFWVKLDDLTASKSQILSTDFTENTYSGVWFGLNPTTQQMQVSYGSAIAGCTAGHCRRTKQGTTVFQTGIWYFVAGVIRGPLDMDLYINCENDGGTYTGTGGDMAYGGSSGSLGQTDQATLDPYYFKGSLDEFRYWNRALSSTEIISTENNSLCHLITGIESLKRNTKGIYKIYPNPVLDNLFLTSELSFNGVSYSIHDIIGKSLISGTLNNTNNKIDVNTLTPGVYFISFKGINKIETLKFIKD